MLRAAAAISASVVVLAAAGCGGDSSTSTGASAADTAATSVPTATTPATTATPAAATCTKVAAPAPKGEQSLTAPTTRLDPAKTWTATVKTNCGDFTMALDAKQAPKTSASFASLARTGFYNGLTFHRIVPGFVIQGGDPLGNGQGGPGYSIVEAPPATLKYTRGVVAMAKTEAEAPGTSGSQFFVVTGADAALPPDYALAGRVKSGQDVVDLIGKVPTDPQTQQPLSPVVIEKITITGS